ncbi:hypothetical protein IEQ34_010577 [Dendrobium chrysotoxum]|uniref:Uncharacterized protein n=1 Tax=Dendrobium chrysotoxum TaxID=161865 RepID=A0AAV7GDQ7_DENCH|nr:hypothetical protein IEQ34_010577 [Dendrobium chrysotoxum]
MQLKCVPGEDAAAITGMVTGAAGLKMSLVIRMNRKSLRAARTSPLPVRGVLALEMLLDADEVSKCMRRVVV